MQTGTCTYTVRNFVRFYGLGECNPQNTTEVSSRDPSKVAIPDKAHSFVFYDEVTATIELGGQQVTLVNQNEHVFPFQKLNTSRVHYCGGTLYGLEDGERLFHDHESVDASLEDDHKQSTIFDKIREGMCPGVTHVIQCRDGNIRLFCEGQDLIVPLPEMIPA